MLIILYIYWFFNKYPVRLSSHTYQTLSPASCYHRIPSGTFQSALFTLLSEHPSLFSFTFFPTIKIHLSKALPSSPTISRSCRWLNKLIDGMPDWHFQPTTLPYPTPPFYDWIWTHPHILTNATLLLSSSTCRCVPRHESGLKLSPPPLTESGEVISGNP